MICPNCGAENNDRDVCSSCGKFLYNINRKNRYTLTPEEKRKRVLVGIWYVISRTAVILLILLGLMIISFLIILGIQYLTG